MLPSSLDRKDADTTAPWTGRIPTGQPFWHGADGHIEIGANNWFPGAKTTGQRRNKSGRHWG